MNDIYYLKQIHKNLDRLKKLNKPTITAICAGIEQLLNNPQVQLNQLKGIHNAVNKILDQEQGA